MVVAEPFIFSSELPFPDLTYGGADWGDYDNDGDLDLLLAGQDNLSNKYTKLYQNLSGSGFAEVPSAFTNISGSHGKITLEWIDLNNDNFLDILLIGSTSMTGNGDKVFEIYRNNSGSSFTQVYSISGEDYQIHYHQIQ